MDTPHPRRIPTRFLIMSDTTGLPISPQDWMTLPEVDVVIHCGGLRRFNEPKIRQDTLDVLERLKAHLKLVIPGPNDIYFDPQTVSNLKKRKPDADVYRYLSVDLLNSLEVAESHGIHHLDEGTHRFILANGARLCVYASSWMPHTGQPPFAFGPPEQPAPGTGHPRVAVRADAVSQPFEGWAFRFRPEGHHFDIPSGCDIVMTHGPPKSILDRNLSLIVEHKSLPATDPRRTWSIGCEALREAVARSRPRVHCFGYARESWGVQLIRWGEERRWDAPGQAHPMKLATLANERAAAQRPGRTLWRKVDCSDQEVDRRRSVFPGDNTTFINATVTDEMCTEIRRVHYLVMDLDEATPDEAGPAGANLAEQ